MSTRLFDMLGVRRSREWKYVNKCRLFVYVDHSIDAGMQWGVIDPKRPARPHSILMPIFRTIFVHLS
jgi:phage tail sheath protein FI